MPSLLQFFFPMRCVGCKRYDARGFCESCVKKGLGNPVFFRAPGLHKGISLGAYQWPLQEAVAAFKFNHQRNLGKILGEMLSHKIRALTWPVDLVSFVPLAKRRIRQRGFNQAKILAARIAENLHLPCLELLSFTRPIRHQVGLGRKARIENVKGSLALYQKKIVNEKSVLLVDDVVTTGATLSECAAVLKHGGAAKIYAACIAYDREKKD